MRTKRRCGAANLFSCCTPRFLLTWATLSTLGSIILGLVLFFSLLQKGSLSDEEYDANVIPNTNIPSNYTVRLNVRMGATDPDKEIVKFPYASAHTTAVYALLRLTMAPQAEIQSFRAAENLTLNSVYYFLVSFSGEVISGRGPQFITLQSATNLTNSTGSESGETYALSFVNPGGATRGLRYVMPCFDADNFPASFRIFIEHRQTVTALSNGVSVRQEATSEETLVDTFEPALVLRPSQNAFIVTAMERRSVERNGVNVTIYFRPEVLEGLSLRRLMQFMDTADAVSKLDAVILPDVTTAYQPGIAVVNEEETVAENRELTTDSLID